MTTTHQIAAEAAKQIDQHLRARPNHAWSVDRFEQIIAAAIEKAYPKLCTKIAMLNKLQKLTEDNLARYMERESRAAHASGEPRCANCGKPATCKGEYETSTGVEHYACNECCGHGNEDGHCEPIHKAAAAHTSEEDSDAAKMIERAQELVDVEEYPNL